MKLRIQSSDAVINDVNVYSELISSFWFWLAIFEFIIIISFIIFLKKRKSNLKYHDTLKSDVETAKKVKVNMESLMKSINGSKELYKELSKVCHPDRFVNSNKEQIAEEIFQEISENKRNFDKLLDLKERAINELCINFKKEK